MNGTMSLRRRQMVERVPGWLERVLLPRLSEIAGETKAIHARIDGLDVKLGEMDKRLTANDEHLSAKVDAVDEKLSGKIDDLDKRLDIVQRLAVLEAKMGEPRPKG